MKECRLIAKDPEIDITIPMGDGPAYPTGGLGGWGTVARVDNVAMTDWEGQEPLAEDLPLLLDGYAAGSSQAREWNTVKKLGRDTTEPERKPPVFKVFGPIDAPEGKSWVLGEGGIEVNPTSIIKRDDGELLRIEFTLHLLEYVRPDALRRKRKQKNKIGISRARALTTRSGDTLTKVAGEQLGDWKRWPELAATSGINDPNRELPAGVDLLKRGAGASESLILHDYSRFAKWAERHGYSHTLGTGAWIALLNDYSANQGVSEDKMTALHGSAAGDSQNWRGRWNNG